MNAEVPRLRPTAEWFAVGLAFLSAVIIATLYLSSRDAASEAKVTLLEARITAIERRNEVQDANIGALDTAGSRQIPLLIERQNLCSAQINTLTQKLDALSTALSHHDDRARPTK